MRWASVCSGIEAPGVAWDPLGWEQAWCSEIDTNACRILEARRPGIPNLGNSIAVPVLRWIGERIMQVGDTP